MDIGVGVDQSLSHCSPQSWSFWACLCSCVRDAVYRNLLTDFTAYVTELQSHFQPYQMLECTWIVFGCLYKGSTFTSSTVIAV